MQRQGAAVTHQVRDVNRVLEFNGSLLAHSTSWRHGAQRWVEFSLYKTQAGAYVLSRVGISLLFHTSDCAIARRNKLKLADAAGLDQDSVGCEVCRPPTEGTICPEEPRYWAQLSDDAEGIVEALWKYDEHGARYYTLVVRRLLDEASKLDPDIETAYRVEHIA